MSEETILAKTTRFNELPEKPAQDICIKLIKKELEKKAEIFFHNLIMEKALSTLSSLGFDVMSVKLKPESKPPVSETGFCFSGRISAPLAESLVKNRVQAWKVPSRAVIIIERGIVMGELASVPSKISLDGKEVEGFHQEIGAVTDWLEEFGTRVYTLREAGLELFLTDDFAESFAEAFNPSFISTTSYKAVEL